MPERTPSNNIWKWSFIQQKVHLCLRPSSLDDTLNRPSSTWESFKIRQKLGLFVFKGHSHIEFSHSLRQIDTSGWVGLALWSYDLTHEISIFVKILFNFKKKILAWIKANLTTLLTLPKAKNLNLLHHVTLRPNLSKTHIEQSVESNFFKNFKVIASLPILHPYFRFFYIYVSKDFSENPINLDMGI